MVALAQNPETSVLTPIIAERTQVPPGYLAKVLQALGRADLVKSQRGIGGGFTLARAPGEITVLDVVNAVDPIKRITRCPLNINTHGATLCPLHHELDRAMGLMEDAFRQCTLQQLLSNTPKPQALCSFSTTEPKKGH